MSSERSQRADRRKESLLRRLADEITRAGMARARGPVAFSRLLDHSCVMIAYGSLFRACLPTATLLKALYSIKIALQEDARCGRVLVVASSQSRHSYSLQMPLSLETA